MHTEDNHLCQIITTFTTGLQSLNGLSKQAQYFAVGSSGTDFAIVSSVDTHTFNIPSASASNRGLLSSTDWSTFNAKQAALSGTGIVKSTGGVISYLTDPLPIANGGTGSATQNFVDLTTSQTITGQKTFNSGSGLTIDSTTPVPVPTKLFATNPLFPKLPAPVKTGR